MLINVLPGVYSNWCVFCYGGSVLPTETVCVCVCVCVSGEREGGRERESMIHWSEVTGLWGCCFFSSVRARYASSAALMLSDLAKLDI